MELEFDKEIDAILRKNARGPAAAVSTAKSAHLEADEIAAFAENALPANARSFYVKHLADCDRCRTVLSQTISMIPEAEPVAASSDVNVETIGVVKPTWFQKLLAMPSLAAAMGALVIAFIGLLGYTVYQGSLGSRSTEVASVRRSETASNDNRTFADQAVPSANASSNTAASAANAAAPTITSEGSPLTKTLGQSDVGDQPRLDGLDQKQPVDTGANEKQREEDRDRAASPAAEPSSVAAAPAMKEQPKETDSDAKKLAEGKVEDKRDVAKAESTDAVTVAKPEQAKDANLAINGRTMENNQQNVGGAASKSKSGPYRDMQQRNAPPAKSARADDDEAPAGRRAGGKSFEKKEGVWYDSAYHGQATINIRRGTGEYKILDSGLRNIAESMRGTVVVVWKDKAYRIQ